MGETKTLHKLFWVWEFDKEERWLNEMAQEGWALTNAGFCTYTFGPCEPGEYIIRLEMIDNSPKFQSFMEELGAEAVGKCVNWAYFRRKAELGPFEMFSDIDSRVEHLDKIGRMLTLLCMANLFIGIANYFNSTNHSISLLNLLCAALLSYGLGRIHGMRDGLEKDRALHE